MFEILVYIWTVSISLGICYNILGETIILLLLFIIAILKRRICFNRNFLISTFVFGIFFILKCTSINSYIPISEFHSIKAVISNMIGVLIVFFTIGILGEESTRIKKNMVSIFSFCYHISICVSIFMLIINEKDIYRDTAGGGFLAPHNYLFYAIVISMALTYMIIKNTSNRLRNIILLLINITYVVLANYTTQMIFLFVGIILVYINCKTREKAITGITFFVVVLIIMPLLPDLIQIINEKIFINNQTVYIRLNEIVTLLNGQSIVGSDIESRLNLSRVSLETFKSNPLFGVSYNMYNTVATRLVVGGHAQWVDDIARYGLIGISFFFLFIYQGFKNVIFSGIKKLNKFEISVIILFLVYGFFNPFIRSAFIIVVFVVVQYIRMSMSNQELGEK